MLEQSDKPVYTIKALHLLTLFLEEIGIGSGDYGNLRVEITDGHVRTISIERTTLVRLKEVRQ